MSLYPKALGAAAALLMAFPAWAQDACPYQPAILSLSASVLDKRPELSKFPARNFGAEAAYLTLVYGGLDDAAAGALLQPLLDAGVRDIRDLVFAWTYRSPGNATTTRVLGDDAVAAAIASNGISAMRAMIRAGSEDELVAALAAMRDNDAMITMRSIVVAVVDAPDAHKQDLAAKFIAAERPLLAAGLIATLEKPKSWSVFVKALGDPETVKLATQAWSWTPGLVGNPALPRTPEQGPAADPDVSAKIHDILIAAALEPEADFLNIVLNQTGKLDEVASAASTVRAAIDSGSISREGTLDDAWMLAYRTLRQTFDPAAIEDVLGSIDSPAKRQDQTVVLDTLDWLIAFDALGPYLREEADWPADQPTELSADFTAERWMHWLELATDVRDGDLPAADESNVSLISEMLLEAGKVDAIAAYIAGAPASTPVLNVANDMAKRLDRMCGSYLWHPAEAITLAGRPIFKFG